ncbi:MAG: rod shape-determining protein MreD [Leptospira sp.]|nr:rod shape-determining protein MreD [Leptospira sp.]
MILEKSVIAIGILVAHFLNGSNLFELGSSIKPDFMIILVIFFALRKGTLSGLWVGFFGGLLSDTGLGGEIGAKGEILYKIGLHTLSFSMIGYFLGKFGRTAYNENFISISVTTFIITLLARLSTYFLFSIFFHSNLNYAFFSTSLYNAAIAPIVFSALTWIYRLDPASEH